MGNRENDREAGERERITTPAAFIKTARGHLQRGEQKAAYAVLLKAVLHYPEHALILSYYGCLQSVIDRKYRSGIESCRRALQKFKAPDSYSAGIAYPLLYLNLGRACIAARRKKEAIQALSKGLQYDRANREIKKELLLLGIRKKPAVPFLSRSNPINKYIGMILHGPQKGAKSRLGH